MNINDIYREKQNFLEESIATMYNKFVIDLGKDKDYTLSDDEASELFNELLLKYMRFSMSEYEWKRIIKELENYKLTDIL